jgi:L-seryl-tRNA(Ser) seleniumtransferase
MDVFPETWSYRSLIACGKVAGPPHHGIGRGYKVGKEEIVGLLVALKRYMERDLDAEFREWRATAQYLVDGINRIPGLRAEVQLPQPGGRAHPIARVFVDKQAAGLDAAGVINALQEGDPMICVFEAHASEGMIVIFPDALQPGDAEVIVDRFEAILAGRNG